MLTYSTPYAIIISGGEKNEQEAQKAQEPEETHTTVNSNRNSLNRNCKFDTGSQVKARGESPKPLHDYNSFENIYED